MIICSCGCGEEVVGRKDKKYVNRLHRYRRRNKRRASIQRHAIVLAMELLVGFGYEVTKPVRRKPNTASRA